MLPSSRIHTPIGPNRLTLQPGQPVPEMSHDEQNVGIVSSVWISLTLSCSLDLSQAFLWSAYIHSEIFMYSDAVLQVNTRTKAPMTRDTHLRL